MLDAILPDLRAGVYRHLDCLPFFVGINFILFNQGESLDILYYQSAYRLLYVRKGTIKLVLDEQELILASGALILLKPDIKCSCHNAGVKSELMVLGFVILGGDEEELKVSNLEKSWQDFQHIKLNELVSLAIKEKVNIDDVTYFSERLIADMRQIIEFMYKENNIEDNASKFMLRLYFAQLIVLLIRSIEENWGLNKRIRSGDLSELLDVSLRFILDNCNRDLTVTDVANNIYLSPGYFARAFREKTGISPLSFIFQVRIARACKLLEADNRKVQSIASEVGFASPQRFNSAFRKHMGMTPKKYRQYCQQRSIDSSVDSFYELPEEFNSD